MSGEEFGQVCGSCHGVGILAEQRIKYSDGEERMVSAVETHACYSCSGTGWVYGRNR